METTGPADDLAVHDVMISHQQQFNRAGQPQQLTVMSYYIGPHGPFVRTYSEGEATPDKMRAELTSHIADLRRTLQPL